jgi:hypothetical protein
MALLLLNQYCATFLYLIKMAIAPHQFLIYIFIHLNYTTKLHEVFYPCVTYIIKLQFYPYIWAVNSKTRINLNSSSIV